MSNTDTVKEPLLKMSKRPGISFPKSCLIRFIAVILGLIVCAVFITVITKLNPVEVYSGIINGAIGTGRRSWVTVRETLVLLLVALGLTPAFKMRFWNIGAEGQVLVGGIASAALMIYIGDKIPNALLLILIFIVSMLSGMLWGIVPAIFKAYFNTNETLFTLMLNYVAIQLVSFCIVFWENPVGSNSVGVINAASSAGWFPQVFGLTYGLNVILVLVLTIGMYIYLRYTKHGYEIAVVGESENTARYAGISVKKVVVRTMALSGAICGLAGALVVSGASHTISTSIAGGRGFTAIIVAWMSKLNPFTMILVSFFLFFMQEGTIQIAADYGLNESSSDIITGILLFFLIGCEFFINYRVSFRRNHKEQA